MTKKEKEAGTDRQPYRKPQLEQVRIEVEEAVLTACKIVGVVGKDEPGCKPGTAKCKSVWTGS
jgi:hypothetical protein